MTDRQIIFFLTKEIADKWGSSRGERPHTVNKHAAIEMLFDPYYHDEFKIIVLGGN